MKKSRLLGVVCACNILFISQPCGAALVDYGDSTIDTETGLEWLDISLTVGQAYNDVLASGFVVNDGYRYATEEEVYQLFTNAGGTPSPGWDNWLVSNIAPAQLLLNLMGCTSYLLSGHYGYPCDGIYEDWAAAMWGSSSEYIAIINDHYHYGPNSDEHVGLLWTRWGTHGDDATSRRADVGSFLVRNSAVPIPPAIWLFGSGLLGLIGIARKK